MKYPNPITGTITMENPALGKIISSDDKAERDAIHIAIAPIVAFQELYPGQQIALNDDGEAIEPDPEEGYAAVGIVDPFLVNTTIKAGEKFWILLFPKSITSLRHEWTHPAFDNKEYKQVQKALVFMAEAAKIAGVNVHELLNAIKSKETIHMGDNQSYDAIDQKEFIKHAKVLFGKSDVYPPFSCAC